MRDARVDSILLWNMSSLKPGLGEVLCISYVGRHSEMSVRLKGLKRYMCKSSENGGMLWLCAYNAVPNPRANMCLFVGWIFNMYLY